MPKAKRKITINRKKNPVELDETSVSTVAENEISNEEIESWTIIQKEQPITVKRTKKARVIGDVGGSIISKPQGRIKFEAQVAAFPMYRVPEDIRQYLINKWLTTDVYKKSKEWLEKHHVDLEIVEKLKKFLTEKL